MKPHPLPHYTVGEEIFNSVTHGVGALLAVAGTGVLITLAACRGDALCVVACCVYSLSLIILYTMSTLYHAFPFEKVKSSFAFLTMPPFSFSLPGLIPPSACWHSGAIPRG